jgi:hypothetical protein
LWNSSRKKENSASFVIPMQETPLKKHSRGRW